MKFCLSFLINVFAVAFSFGQSTKNQEDLDFLYSKIVKLPSYKNQFSNKEKTGFKQKYNSLKVGIGSNNDLDLFMKLYALIAPVNDNHLGFYTNPKSDVKIFLNSTPLSINKDSLLKAAILKPENSVEGIYKVGNGQFVIDKVSYWYKVYSIENDKLKQFALLKETGINHFDYIFNFPNGILMLDRNVAYLNKRLTRTPFKKYKINDFANIAQTVERFVFKKVSNNLSYLRLGSFNASDKDLVVSNLFYNKIKDSLLTKNIIVDLRDNGGGAFKTSRVYLKILKQFKGKIHIIINNNTASNAEQFILKLKDDNNVVLYGETTKGMIAYGSNRGTTLKLPSGRFVFYPTDMNATKQHIKLENVGIKPDVLLNPFSKDWIEQVMDKIDVK